MLTLLILAMHDSVNVMNTSSGCRTTDCISNKEYSSGSDLYVTGCCCTSGGQCASGLCDYHSTWSCLASLNPHPPPHAHTLQPSPPQPYNSPPHTPSSYYQLATSTLCGKSGSYASYNNWNLTDNDYYSNLAHCRTICDADPACHAFTLFRNTQRCWLYGNQSVINGYYAPNGVFYDSKVGQWVPNPACPDYTSSSPYHTSSICYYWPTGDSTGNTLWDCYYTSTALRNTTCDEWNVCPSPPPPPPPPQPPPPPPQAPPPPAPPPPPQAPSPPPNNVSPPLLPLPVTSSASPSPPPLPPLAAIPPACPHNQVWVECGSACTPTCADPAPICVMQCVARCQCHASIPILRSDGQCVHINECNDCDALRAAYHQAGCCTAR